MVTYWYIAELRILSTQHDGIRKDRKTNDTVTYKNSSPENIALFDRHMLYSINMDNEQNDVQKCVQTI
jgi:hypothetical protein